ncbi:anti-sigma factor [Alteriqipengyuania sp. WL0013]|uniref:anti-sigma factor n=1 Tax=Alteriqipengyuania sp. WL0013 TaxID=3110773 RepID=UPI002C3D99B5|nr:anti-sigma factor [Alteriqipengyuania sp. WL0013]MEB3415940.1 anti-sigma factor [Alteriqipengyuania sp. WL0013]
MADDLPPLSPEDERFVRAGELSLGVLEGEELATAKRDQLADPDFADAVAWWDNRLGTMAEQAAAMSPGAGVWRAIEQRLDSYRSGNTPASLGAVTSRRPAGWSVALAVGGAGLAAAALALFLATPRPAAVGPAVEPSQNQRGPQLVAQLSDESGALGIASVIDPSAERLALKIRGFEPGPEESPELWVVPAGGAPISLGLIPASDEFERDLSAEERALLVEGATLAVTIEQRDGAPHDAPSTPILVAGPLDQV